ncbi:hypothetical protein BGZ65_006470, partial [Modicella reniformis]
IYTKTCTKLEYLFVDLSFWTPETWNQLTTLIQRNPKLKSFEIRENNEIMSIDFMEAMSACLELRNLQVHMYHLDEACMEHILDIAVRLEHLQINGLSNMLPKSLDKWPCFPAMKKLTLKVETHFPIQLQFEMIRKCPELRALELSTDGHDQFPASDFCDILKTYCPFIEDLKLHYDSMTDMDLSQILESCRKVTTLHMGSAFGEQAFHSLSRHFIDIQYLQCHGLTGAMTQQIMTSCPNLIEFSGANLDARDVIGTEKDETTGEGMMVTQDWICTRMQHLAIFINKVEGKSHELHPGVIRQIAKLRVKTITISQQA